MTRVSVEGPRVEADIAAEQVVAYLLREGSGWTDASIVPWTQSLWRKFAREQALVDVPLNPGLADHGALLVECIGKIARAEGRPAADVLADIAGPASREATGNGSAVCAVGMDGPWLWGGCRRTERCKREAPAGAEVE